MDAVREAGIMDDTVVILTADHGGIETGHGGKTMNEMQTPIVFYGKNVKKGFKIPESTMVYDIAGTIAYLLDVPQPASVDRPSDHVCVLRLGKPWNTGNGPGRIDSFRGVLAYHRAIPTLAVVPSDSLTT